MLDMKANEILGYIGLDAKYEPKKLMTISDINGNGSDELVVYSTQIGGSKQKIQIKDSKTRKFINAVFFDPNFVGIDVTACPDINGNGSEELVLLGKRQSNGKVTAIIKDSKTDALLGKVDF